MRPKEKALSVDLSSREKHAGGLLSISLSTQFNSEAFLLYLVKQSDGPTKLSDTYWSMGTICEEQGVRR